MKLLKTDYKKGIIKIKVENADDLWYLSHIVEEEDTVEGQTERKIKIGSSEDRNKKITRKKIFLDITVEKVEFHKFSNHLRISGKVNEGTDDVSSGSYHTFDIEENDVFTIKKKRFLKYQIDKIKEASKPKPSNTLICAHDRECAYLALLKRYGCEILLELSGEVQKKGLDEKISKNFYQELYEKLKEYVERLKIEHIILASPAFFKEDFLKHVKDENIRKKIITTTISSCNKSSVSEVIRRKEVEQVMKEERVSEELKLIDELLKEISQDGRYAYGLDQIKTALDVGAISKLAVSENLIKKMKEEGNYSQLDDMMRNADAQQARLMVLNADNEPCKKLDGLGGIAAILRFKTE